MFKKDYENEGKKKRDEIETLKRIINEQQEINKRLLIDMI